MRASFFSLALIFAASVVRAEDEVIPASYPEGPLWSGKQLYYAEMGVDRVTVRENGEAHAFFEQGGCGPTAIAPFGDGFLILCHRGARIVAVNCDGEETRRWEADRNGATLVDPNDASADGEGGVYFTDPGRFSHSAPVQGRIMHLAANGILTVVADQLHYPNGIHVKGKTLYVSEHLGGRVLRYDIVADGMLAKRSVLIDFANAPLSRRYETAYALVGPDGLEIGRSGDLYVAIYGEGRVVRISPKGEVVGEIETPARFVTNVAFSESGAFATTGAFDNRTPPYPGEVRVQRTNP